MEEPGAEEMAQWGRGFTVHVLKTDPHLLDPQHTHKKLGMVTLPVILPIISTS